MKRDRKIYMVSVYDRRRTHTMYYTNKNRARRFYDRLISEYRKIGFKEIQEARPDIDFSDVYRYHVEPFIAMIGNNALGEEDWRDIRIKTKTIGNYRMDRRTEDVIVRATTEYFIHCKEIRDEVINKLNKSEHEKDNN